MATAKLTYQPMTNEEMRVHALNLAVAGRKDSIRFLDKDTEEEHFAVICVQDASKYLAFLKGDDERDTASTD